MRVMARILAVAFLAAMLAVTAAADQKQPGQSLNVAIEGAKVTVQGATPGGKVVFFGIGRFVKQYRVTVRRMDKTVADDDHDGKVVLDIGEAIPWKTIFAAVDFTSGRYGMATPAEFPLVPIRFDKEIMVANNGQLDRLIVEYRFLHLLIVRPGVGVWAQILGDGNKFDDDGPGNSKVVSDISKSIALGDKVPAPKKYEKGDIVVLIDPNRMQSFTVEVGTK